MSPRGARLTTYAETDEFALNEADILVDPQTGRPIANWSKLGTVVNRVDLKYDYNVAGLVADDFARRQVYTADASYQRYSAQPSITEEFRGLRSASGATQAF